MKIARWVSMGVLTAALLAGCGKADETVKAVEKRPTAPREVHVVLNGYMSPENVGILMAIERGFFADVGLEVWAGAPVKPSRPVNYVATGTDELGVVQQPQVAIAGDKGVPVVAVGSLVSRPTAAMIWLKKSKIRGIADLKGKTIAVPGIPYQEGFLQALLARANLTLEDVKIERVGYELMSTLLGGRADAIFGSWNLEGAALKARGAKPVIKRVQSLGVPAYEELAVIARADDVAEDSQLIRDFMAAVARGTAAAVEDPKSAVSVIEKGLEPNPEATRKETEAQVKATLPLLSRSGYMDPGQASDLVVWMHDHALIQEEPPVSDLLTNDYLSSP